MAIFRAAQTEALDSLRAEQRRRDAALAPAERVALADALTREAMASSAGEPLGTSDESTKHWVGMLARLRGCP